MLVDGFLSSRENILVPVAEIPSISQLSVLPSSQAYLASSEHIHKFLAVPLVPFRLLTNTLFTRLKEHGLIQSVSHDLIKSTVASCDLSVEEVIELLHWLCTDEVKNEKRFIERILSFILFHDDEASSKIMENVKFYDGFNVPTILPLPINVLPTRLARHISNDDLHQKLSLTALTLDSLLDFYLHEDQRFLWGSQTTVVCLFNLISKYWSQLDKSKREAMKNTLSNIKCVPTTQGMKIPKEAYIRSPILSSDLALIELSVVKSMDEVDVHATAISSGRTTTLVEASDNRVLAEFLKNLGCRTINIQSFVGNHKAKSNALSPSKNRLQMLVQLLVDEFDNLSEADIEAIKYTECFPGRPSCHAT